MPTVDTEPQPSPIPELVHILCPVSKLTDVLFHGDFESATTQIEPSRKPMWEVSHFLSSYIRLYLHSNSQPGNSIEPRRHLSGISAHKDSESLNPCFGISLDHKLETNHKSQGQKIISLKLKMEKSLIEKKICAKQDLRVVYLNVKVHGIILA